jgi:steroid delta-isomerase-like uncharacterized protein
MTVAPTISNAALARRWFEEVWGQQRLETIDELMSESAVCYSEQGPLTGPEQFKQSVFFPMTAAFPDLRIQVEDVLEAGDNVVVRWSVAATHTGNALGFPATGRRVNFQGMTWVQLRNGKFAEGWQSSNIPAVLQELAAAQTDSSASRLP